MAPNNSTIVRQVKELQK